MFSFESDFHFETDFSYEANILWSFTSCEISARIVRRWFRNSFSRFLIDEEFFSWWTSCVKIVFLSVTNVTFTERSEFRKSYTQRSLCTFERFCLFIDPGMKRDHVLSTWSRRTTHWTLNRTLISRSSVLTSFRESYHFQPTTIVLRACSLLVDWDSYHSRSKNESTLISFYSFSHRSEDENHLTTKKQTFETSNFATKRSIDSAR
jgi:hypothetical protein